MRKLLLLSSLFLAAAGAQGPDRSFTATLSAAGVTQGYGMQGGGAHEHTLQVNVGSPATCSIQLEGSLDGVVWSNLSGTQSCLTSTMFHVTGRPVSNVRANLTAYSGGGSVTILYRGSN